MSRVYIIYDGRACGNQGTNNASILFAVGHDRKEATDYMETDIYGQCALYSYRYGGHGTSLTDEQWEGDFVPGGGFTSANKT